MLTALVIVPITFLFFEKDVSLQVEAPTVDPEYPKPLTNPPAIIKAAYATSWSMSLPEKVDYLMDLIESTELNSLIIDIKDYSGYVAYDIDNEKVIKYQAREIRMPNLNDLINRLHDKNIYLIARITIFQDPRLALARPDLAIQDQNGQTWVDGNNLAWVDPASQEVWDYNIAIAKDVLKRGFDEINFDYIRFPSDGDLDNIQYPFWDEITPRHVVIRNFFQYLRENLGEAKISADIFGQTTIEANDLGIGQIIEDAYQYFDYVAPMIYPSHYINGFLDYPNPAEYPYEVVKYSLERAVERFKDYELALLASRNVTTTTSTELNTQHSILNTKLRPWLQVFDIGAVYTPEMVKKEIQAVRDVASSTPELVGGYMLWNPSNIYDKRSF